MGRPRVRPLPPLCIASFDSRHFEFEGVDTTPAKAVDVLRQGLVEHARRCNIESDWFWSDSYGTEREWMAERMAACRTIEVGTAYRDREEI